MDFLMAAGSSLYDAAHHLVVFVIVLSVLVFVHEWGHYWAARRCKVHVEAFSIGFGREIWGRTDRHGTRWRVSLIPLGGYVRLHGQGGPEESFHAEGKADAAEPAQTAPADPPPGAPIAGPYRPGQSFAEKSVGQRAFIVAAGPLANFVLAALLFAGLFMTVGQSVTPPLVTAVQPGSAAERAGIQPNDRVLKLDDHTISRFEDLQRVVRIRPQQPMVAQVERDGQILSLNITPDRRVVEDRFGGSHEMGVLGVSGGVNEIRRHDPLTATWRGMVETVRLSEATLTAVWQMIAGTRAADEIGGPLRIAQLSGRVASDGVVQLLGFIALLSINLALINLFPVPILDGGHLLFYAFEALFGRPLSPRAQEYGFRLGLMLIVVLFVFATWNDLKSLRVVEWVTHLFG
ncbi:MAG: RIP metalloprotease RseP [Alphaproteobacteria bacterium]|nr:RIP metalloprotease RseP [Alphaproteobacteria bacterium]